MAIWKGLFILVCFGSIAASQKIEPKPGPGTEINEVKGGEGDSAVWPLRNVAYGDVSGIAEWGSHSNGELFILHRGPNRWNEGCFNLSNVYQNLEKGPIQEDVLVGIDSITGEQLHSWGRDRFFLPHGLSVDGRGYFWITDVALHQVFKVDPVSLKTSLVLGTAGVPGSDQSHFCKPTDVAVARDGSFFVADGYCNSRIIKFSAEGEFLLEFGRPTISGLTDAGNTLNVPHSLALLENYDLICVANREGEKIQCFTAGLEANSQAGRFVLQVAHPSLSRVFAIRYSQAVNRLYAVNGVGFGLEDKPIMIFSINVLSSEVQTWNPAEDGVVLKAPHGLTVSQDGHYLYVADLSPQPTVWKFENQDFKLPA